MPRVGLVLAGGGVAGYAFHCGVLAALEHQTGWDPRSANLIVGTSSGSIIAAGLRCGLSTKELRRRALAQKPEPHIVRPLDELLGPSSFKMPNLRGGPSALGLVVDELRRGRLLRPMNILAGLLPEGRATTKPLRAVIEPLHPDRWPSAPLWITATGQQTGIRRVFGRDNSNVDVATAVEASCAIPGYFAPVLIGDEPFVDGGLHSPDNADLVTEEGLDVVLVLSPLSIDSYQIRQSPLATILKAYPRRQLRRNVESLRRAGAHVLVLEPDQQMSKAMGLNAMATHRVPAVVEASEPFIDRWTDELDEARRRILQMLA